MGMGRIKGVKDKVLFRKDRSDKGKPREFTQRAFAPENLQWLTAKENQTKNSMWNGINYRKNKNTPQLIQNAKN